MTVYIFTIYFNSHRWSQSAGYGAQMEPQNRARIKSAYTRGPFLCRTQDAAILNVDTLWIGNIYPIKAFHSEDKCCTRSSLEIRFVYR